MTDIPTAEPRTRVERTFNALRGDIINGTLPPGSRLGVERLRARYGVGSSTIREALSLLIADALVTSVGQKGFAVAPISVDDLADLGDVRVLLETNALRESIENADDAWEADIVATYHLLSKAQDRIDAGDAAATSEWEVRNKEFHTALAARSRSRWTRHILDMLNHHSERYRRAALLDRTVPRDVRAEHEELMEATLAHDADRACAVLTQHIRRTTEVLLELTAKRTDLAS
jgi:DNA-binding GntR family transcriptional regulator